MTVVTLIVITIVSQVPQNVVKRISLCCHVCHKNVSVTPRSNYVVNATVPPEYSLSSVDQLSSPYDSGGTQLQSLSVDSRHYSTPTPTPVSQSRCSLMNHISLSTARRPEVLRLTGQSTSSAARRPEVLRLAGQSTSSTARRPEVLRLTGQSTSSTA